MIYTYSQNPKNIKFEIERIQNIQLIKGQYSRLCRFSFVFGFSLV